MAASAGPPHTGSRRRRLWELDGRTHCPLVGVCMPIAALRRLVDKVVDGQASTDDYELHCQAVTQCRRRNPLSEALQKTLDQRHVLSLQRSAKIKTSEDLAAWWAEASAGQDLPGALWSVLTHSRCDVTLADAVLGRVHMLQHQIGMVTRVELERFEALIDENAVLGRELAAAQGRSSRLATSFTKRVDALETEVVHLRGLIAARDAELDQQREWVSALESASPDLGTRQALAQDVARFRDDALSLRKQLDAARDEARAVRARLRRLQTPREAPQAQCEVESATATPPPSLADRAVLCVGGRPASVPLYRLVVERSGGRFLHHDGGQEQSASRLDTTLAAADLVICQTGCVSHDAYWRVKDHCKRTGKRCVFVETPGRAALERALSDVTTDS